MRKEDNVSRDILKIFQNIDEPLETMELLEKLKNITRTKIIYRLNNLRGEGKIKGKMIGSGKGVWVWWKK